MQAIVVLTGSDELNLKIAVMTRFLNPDLRIICRDTDAEHRELLATVGEVTLISPFEIFAHQLDAAVYTPLLRGWEDWLVGDTASTSKIRCGRRAATGCCAVTAGWGGHCMRP